MKTFALRIVTQSLKVLARCIVARYKPTVIGVTGNVGKTSTKEAIRAVISSARTVRAPSKNFNNELGLPLTVIGNWKNTEGIFFWPWVFLRGLLEFIFTNPRYPQTLILEYGVDKPGDMKYLLDIVRPSIGVVSVIGQVPVHVEFFAGPHGLLREKGKLVHQLPTTGFAILNVDDADVMTLAANTRARVITFGFGEAAQVRITTFEERLEDDLGARIAFKLNYGGSFVPVRITGVFGKTHAYAAAAAAAIGLISGMHLVTIAEALERYAPPRGRLCVIPGINGSVIIDDTYNAAPAAMHEALDTLKRIKAARKIAVLGDMLELGKYTIDAHESVGRKAPRAAHLLVTVGSRAKFIAEAAEKTGMTKKAVASFETIREANAHVQNLILPGDLVLVKGSQGVRLEKIVSELMRNQEHASRLLVRQDKQWLEKPGLYDG